MPFQKKVNINLAIGVPGQIASNNPYSIVITTDNGGNTVPLVAGDSGVYVGKFGWLTSVPSVSNSNGDPNVVVNSLQGDMNARMPDGLIVHDHGGIFYDFNAQEGSMLIPSGFQVTLAERGDFYVKSTTACRRGQKAFASTKDGSVSFDVQGANSGSNDVVETNFVCLQNGNAGDIVKIGTDAARVVTSAPMPLPK